MARIVWAPAALEDIEAIAQFIARDAPRRASLFVARLIGATDRLCEFPQCGRVIPQFGDENRRELIVGSYRVMYRVEGEEVWITAVIHDARDYRPDDTAPP